MSDPIRLLASADTTDLERQLLQSWADERPASAAREKTLALLGVTGGAIAAGGAVSASLAPKALAAGWLATAKWLAISIVALSAVGVGVRFVLHRGDPATSVIAPVAPQVTAPVATTIEEAPPPVVQNTSAPVQRTLTTPRSVAPSGSASLAEQIAAVDRARAQLENGDPRGARKLADAYESEYPGGAFTQEAEVVRIDALVHEGNRDAAERAGKHFLAAYPKSPHVARVRALLGYDQ